MGDFNAAIFGLDLCAAGCNLAALVAPLVTATGALRSILALIPVVRGQEEVRCLSTFLHQAWQGARQWLLDCGRSAPAAVTSIDLGALEDQKVQH